MTLSAPSFGALSVDQERQAVEALAELLVPVVLRSVLQPTDAHAQRVTANGDA